ncbi:DUF2339 domain-containing protein [Massilia arenae]|uniref:DUF2339 domain-containing protein n=1 Tax=Massilia arenae TaxID=2603288 RepID=UPI001E596BB0|nr:DUF2339 domain-containing protein [Massilia arenae]
MQGTAIAILMLVIFSAYQLYALLPSGLAFALLVSLTAFTCLLAVLQEAPWLAAFGITGGFASPVLLASGEGGSLIALFTYYALLNAGVFALAFMRSWHPLNLLGFVFTFIIGATWGGLRYTPDHYWSAQAFLILFFLCYFAIPLAFATRERTRTKDYVDIMLVLGTPLLAFGFQVGLVKDMPFGLASTALGLGGFYLALGIALWRSGEERMRMMVEAFAVVGVIFGTLAIPFALGARWTSAAWSAFIVATDLRKHAGDDDSLLELAGVGLLLAAIALLGACWSEAILRTAGGTLANWMVVGALLSAVLLHVVGVRMAWPLARGRPAPS